MGLVRKDNTPFGFLTLEDEHGISHHVVKACIVPRQPNLNFHMNQQWDFGGMLLHHSHGAVRGPLLKDLVRWTFFPTGDMEAADWQKH